MLYFTKTIPVTYTLISYNVDAICEAPTFENSNKRQLKIHF
jgi:hypothetical protein